MIMAGIRLGMGRAVLGMVTSEMILAVVGFGAMLMTFSASFNSPALFATIMTIVLLAVGLLTLIQVLDRRLTLGEPRSERKDRNTKYAHSTEREPSSRGCAQTEQRLL